MIILVLILLFCLLAYMIRKKDIPLHQHHWDALGSSLNAKAVIYECRHCGKIEKGGFGRSGISSVHNHKNESVISLGCSYKLLRTIQEYEVKSVYGVEDDHEFAEIRPSNKRSFQFMGEIKEFEQVYLETYGEEFKPDCILKTKPQKGEHDE